MVVMAIEAAREIAESTEEIYGFELRDVAVVTALQVPDDAKGVEVMVQLHPRRTGTKAAPAPNLHEFTVSSWSTKLNDWTCHARGLVSVTYTSSLSKAMQQELEAENASIGQNFQDARKRCTKPARSFLYDTVETIGMQYGPTFRNMTDLYAGEGESYGIIKIPDTAARMPSNFEFDHVVHPATLDSVLHMLFPSIAGPEQALSEAVVPFSFDRIFISAAAPRTPGTELYGFCSAQKTSYTTWVSSITVGPEDFSKPIIILEGLGLASVGASYEQPESRASCFTQVWHPDVNLNAPETIREVRTYGDTRVGGMFISS